MTERERYRQAVLHARLARITQGGASVREHRAVQLHASNAGAPARPARMIPTYTSGKPMRRALHDYSEPTVLRLEREDKLTVKRNAAGRIVSCRELPPPKWRSHVDTRQRQGLWRVKFTGLDTDADGRLLRHRVRFR
jgi:hypothetical protein